MIRLSKSEKDKDLQYRLYVASKKHDTNELIHRRETDPPTEKTNLWLSKGNEGGGEIN